MGAVKDRVAAKGVPSLFSGLKSTAIFALPYAVVFHTAQVWYNSLSPGYSSSAVSYSDMTAADHFSRLVQKRFRRKRSAERHCPVAVTGKVERHLRDVGLFRWQYCRELCRCADGGLEAPRASSWSCVPSKSRPGLSACASRETFSAERICALMQCDAWGLRSACVCVCECVWSVQVEEHETC